MDPITSISSISSLLSLFGQNKPPPLLLEEVIFALLKQYLRNQGKTLDTNIVLAPGWEVDAVALQGINDLPGPTVIEIKHRIVDQRHIEQTLDRLGRTVKKLNAKSSLLIVTGDLASNDLRQVLNEAHKRPALNTFLVWSAQELNPILKDNIEYLPNIGLSISRERVDNIIDKGIAGVSDNWKRTRDSFLQEVRNEYKKNNLVLFLGAGVSFESGIPTWNGLLKDLLIAMVAKRMNETLSKEEIHKVAQRLQERHGASPLLIARYIRAGLGDDFSTELTKALYKGVNSVSTSSSVLKEISKLCVPSFDGSGIRAVITYNFDDLLEGILRDVGVTHRSIYRENDVTKGNELGIFHVHGYLPRDNRSDELINTVLVFSEEGYHTMFMDPYSWSNIVQLSYLRERTCLLIGLSAQDPNLRRLAEFSARKMKLAKHYIILRRDALESMEEQNVAKVFDGIHHGLQESALRELGLNVIWIQDYAELPILIRQLKNDQP